VNADVVGYTVDTLQYGWLENPVDIDKSLEVAQFTLVHYVQHDCSQNYTAGARSFTLDKRIKTYAVAATRITVLKMISSQLLSLIT